MSALKQTFKQYLIEARYYGENDDVECPECFGKGKEPIRGPSPDDGYNWSECHECGGSGKVQQRRRNQIKAKHDSITKKHDRYIKNNH